MTDDSLVTGIAWYRRDQWGRLRELAADPDKLEESYEDWLVGAQGFFEYDQYEAVRRRLRPHLQVSTAIAYAFGWRTQSEVLTLERRQLDLATGTIRLEPGTTKNDDGRVVYLPPTSRLSSQPRSSACGRWRDRPVGSFRTCSHTSPAGSGGSVLGTSGRRGRQRARRQALPGACVMTSGERPFATW